MQIELLRVEHAPLLVEAAHESVKDVQPWMPWCSPSFSVTDAEAWIQEQIRAREQSSAFEFAFVSGSGRYLGGGGINHVRTDHNFANVGYWVRSSEAGAGVGTQR